METHIPLDGHDTGEPHSTMLHWFLNASEINLALIAHPLDVSCTRWDRSLRTWGDPTEWSSGWSIAVNHSLTALNYLTLSHSLIFVDRHRTLGALFTSGSKIVTLIHRATISNLLHTVRFITAWHLVIRLHWVSHANSGHRFAMGATTAAMDVQIAVRLADLSVTTAHLFKVAQTGSICLSTSNIICVQVSDTLSSHRQSLRNVSFNYTVVSIETSWILFKEITGLNGVSHWVLWVKRVSPPRRLPIFSVNIVVAMAVVRLLPYVGDPIGGTLNVITTDRISHTLAQVMRVPRLCTLNIAFRYGVPNEASWFLSCSLKRLQFVFRLKGISCSALCLELYNARCWFLDSTSRQICLNFVC